jgi:hypothetical protein
VPFLAQKLTIWNQAMNNTIRREPTAAFLGGAILVLLICQIDPNRAVCQEAGAPPTRIQQGPHLKASRRQLAEIGKAMLKYEKAKGHFPPRAIFDKSGKPLLSWRVLLLPYLGQEELFKQFRLDESWDSPHNKALLARMPAVYRNPDDPAKSTQTNYLVPVGPGTIFEGTEGLKRSKLAHPAEFTLLVVEADRDAEVDWTKPDDLPYTHAKPARGLFHYRPEGFLAASASGSTLVFTPSSDTEMLGFVFEYAARQGQ